MPTRLPHIDSSTVLDGFLLAVASANVWARGAVLEAKGDQKG